MKNKINIVLALITLALMGASVFVYMKQDHVPPVINISENEITYESGQDESVLLKGVTAQDDKDGDLTASIRLYDIAVLEDGNQAVVTYAVYDKSNNLGKATRVINYKGKQNSTKIDSESDESKESESEK